MKTTLGAFSASDRSLQILGYQLEISGNDLHEEDYMAGLYEREMFSDVEIIECYSNVKALTRFQGFVSATTSLNRKDIKEFQELAKVFHVAAPPFIKSDEVRVALMIGMAEEGYPLSYVLKRLNCRIADVLRFPAVSYDFKGVKLPSDVLYANQKWAQRVDSMSFLNGHDFDFLCENMGMNGTAWARWFNHCHITSQKDFAERFPKVVAAALVSINSKSGIATAAPVARELKEYRSNYDITAGGNMVYRTWASRVQAAVESKNVESFVKEVSTRPTMFFRNLTTYSHVVSSEKDQKVFLSLACLLIKKASPSVLFSIIQIDTNAKYRIIDVKGDTRIMEADYHPVVSGVQKITRDELKNRYGVKGKIVVSEELKTKMVPFLSTNTELDRGARIPFEDKKYLYFIMHWVQKNRITDLDHSFVCFDKNWGKTVVYFGNQGNSYIQQSGDVTNAPGPHGGTEYSKIALGKIPPRVRYIAPVCNVFSGELFSENEVAYAGFRFSDTDFFSIQKDHVRYDLTRPANANVPFIIDVEKKELVMVDFNSSGRGSLAESSTKDLKEIIEVLNTKKFMTIERFANLLSGDGDEVSLTIGADGIDLNDLHTLVA